MEKFYFSFEIHLNLMSFIYRVDSLKAIEAALKTYSYAYFDTNIECSSVFIVCHIEFKC